MNLVNANLKQGMIDLKKDMKERFGWASDSIYMDCDAMDDKPGTKKVPVTDEQGNEDDPPVSPAGSIAVGTPVHPGDAPAAAPQDFKKAGGAAAQDPMAPAPPSAPVLASAPPSGKPPASHSEGVPDLPDTPSPLHLNLNINVVDVDEDVDEVVTGQGRFTHVEKYSRKFSEHPCSPCSSPASGAPGS